MAPAPTAIVLLGKSTGMVATICPISRVSSGVAVKMRVDVMAMVGLAGIDVAIGVAAGAQAGSNRIANIHNRVSPFEVFIFASFGWIKYFV